MSLRTRSDRGAAGHRMDEVAGRYRSLGLVIVSVQPRWIDLDGAANVRDLGGLPAGDGGSVRPGRLIRADNLQGLTPSDVDRLVAGHDVRAVADLRSEE